MKNKIERIVEKEDGRVFTVSRGNLPPAGLPQQTIDDLVEQGMDREEAENLKTNVVSIRIMRAPHMETDVVVSPATENLINQIRDKK